MASLLIRNLDDSVWKALRSLAQRHGRSIEAEAKDILSREAKADQRIDWSTITTVDSGQGGHVTRDIINGTYDERERKSARTSLSEKAKGRHENFASVGPKKNTDDG